jgi:allantoicase
MTDSAPPANDENVAGTVLDGLVDLASHRLGGRAVEANDEFFAPKENLLKPEDAVFDPDRYTERGKWMDGWETRRRRSPGHDWCVVSLGAPGRIRRVIVDTRHFRGNHPEACSLDAWVSGADWTEILPRTALTGDTANEFEVADDTGFARVRLNIYPDGGVARLRILGEPQPDWPALTASGERLDLAAALNGGAPLACSDRFFSEPRNLLLPGPPTHMGDGWETRRRRGAGHDWVVIRLGHPGNIELVEVDTTYFKGNCPAACGLEGCRSPALESGGGCRGDAEWRELLGRSELGPDAAHRFELGDAASEPVSHVRFSIYPDGGVARLRLWGRPIP